MRVTRSRLIKPGLMGLAVLFGAAGCSTTDTFEQPKTLPDIEASVELDPIWSMSVGDGHDDEYLYLSPLNTGDLLYAASADGTVYAVQSDNGKVIWKRELDDRIFSGVGGDGQHLYLTTREADLVALSREDGAEVWRVGLPTEVLSAPQSNGRMVVAQTTDGRVLAFDADSGESRWKYDGVVPVLSMRAAAAPLVGGDVVIASFSNGKLIALSAENGQPLWQYAVGEPQGRTELERLVDISGQPVVLDTAIMAVGYQGKLALVDVRTGQEIWSKKASSLYAPSVGGGNIFLAEANGNVLALRGSDRRELWEQDRLAWRQLTQPVVSGDYLVAGDFEGYLHVFSREDGSLQGQLDFDDDGIRVPAQRLENGNLLIYGNGGRMSVLQIQPIE